MKEKLFSYQDIMDALDKTKIKAYDCAMLLIELRNIAEGRPNVNHSTPQEKEAR